MEYGPSGEGPNANCPLLMRETQELFQRVYAALLGHKVRVHAVVRQHGRLELFVDPEGEALQH